MILLDHAKELYLLDYGLLEKYGVIRKGAILIADNIIFPGAPNYLAHFKQNKQYDNVL
jgi:predicted O-methyltransferase YrrM